jgi:hypothetical protein
MNHSPRFYVSGHCWTGGAVTGAKISGISADFEQTLLPFPASNRQLDFSCSIEIECPEVTKGTAAQRDLLPADSTKEESSDGI